MSFEISKKLQRKLNKVNKIVDKGVTGSNQTEYSYKKDMVNYYFEAKDVVIGGYYVYDKKGKVSEWSFTDLTQYDVAQKDPVFRYTFTVEGNKNFKKNVQHLGQTLRTKDYLTLLTDLATTGDGTAMAEFLDQLDGVKAGNYSTGVQTYASNQFYFA